VATKVHSSALAMSCLYSHFLRTSLHSRPAYPFIRTFTQSRNTTIRSFSNYHSKMSSSDLFVELTAPNGRKYSQPRGLFINNEFVKSKSGETISTVNPSNEEEICSVYSAGPEDVDIAVAYVIVHGTLIDSH
jgi:hypothetical protein